MRHGPQPAWIDGCDVAETRTSCMHQARWELAIHEHGGTEYLDHDHVGLSSYASSLEPLDGIERHVLHSVGIDIGSSTSHFVMSRLTIRRRGADLSAEFVVADRETLYRSPIWLTPYREGDRLIDTDELRVQMENAYEEAGIRPDAVDTGAVVITGEALKKENAEQIASMLAGWSGRFVCVSAGPNHEAILAAHGSGAVDASQQASTTVVNVDIGGGTTKVSVIDNGVISHVESVSVGARLLAFDDHGRIARIEEPARVVLRSLGITAGLGDALTSAERTAVADSMAGVLIGLLAGEHADPDLYHTLHVATDDHPMPPPAGIGQIVFSGGVSAFLSDDPPAEFGDLGADLAQAVRARIAVAGFDDRVITAHQGIRATVMGASEFTIQASGQTCFVSDPSMLPVRGLRALPIDWRAGVSIDAIYAGLRRHDMTAWNDTLAAVVAVDDFVGYRWLRQAAEALVTVAAGDAIRPLFVVLKQDLARSLGAIIKEELHWPGGVVVVDGITVGELDHIDLGARLGESGSMPVTVTSLEFPSRLPPASSHVQSHHM
jgi:ethanolamine utilization protein EutA